MIKKEIEYEFEQFKQSLSFSLEQQDVDFIGIDFDKDQISFKSYVSMKPGNLCKDVFLKLSPSGFLEKLSEKNMIYSLETVQDTRKNWVGRYDIALKNRTNDNMTWLFQQFKMKAPFMSKYEMQLLKMSSMKIAEHSNYRLAALYHLGCLEKEGRIQAMKFYFTARHQNIPEYHSKNFEYHDEEYLEFWGGCGIAVFSELKDVVRDMRAYCGGHLWLAGIDISENIISRCKIYLKEMNNVYEYLKTVFNGIYCKRIEQLEAWQRKYPQFIMMGIAIGINRLGTPSLNLYFRIV